MSPSPIDFGAGVPPRLALHRVGRIVFQRWYGAPERGDAMHVIQWVGTERRTLGAELALVEVVSADAPLPKREVVTEAISVVRGYKYIRFCHLVVIEGDALDRRIARGIFTTMSFLLGETLDVMPTVSDAIARAAAAVGNDIEETTLVLDRLGVLRPP